MMNIIQGTLTVSRGLLDCEDGGTTIHYNVQNYEPNDTE